MWLSNCIGQFWYKSKLFQKRLPEERRKGLGLGNSCVRWRPAGRRLSSVWGGRRGWWRGAGDSDGEGDGCCLVIYLLRCVNNILIKATVNPCYILKLALNTCKVATNLDNKDNGQRKLNDVNAHRKRLILGRQNVSFNFGYTLFCVYWCNKRQYYNRKEIKEQIYEKRQSYSGKKRKLNGSISVFFHKF